MGGPISGSIQLRARVCRSEIFLYLSGAQGLSFGPFHIENLMLFDGSKNYSVPRLHEALLHSALCLAIYSLVAVVHNFLHERNVHQRADKMTQKWQPNHKAGHLGNCSAVKQFMLASFF